MSKKNPTIANEMAYMNHLRKVNDMREGRVQRAATFTNRKKEANRKACRGRVNY